MPLLLFKREFYDAIRRGDKTTTLRRWKSPIVAAGNRVNSPRVGWLRILACDRVKLADLKSADAKADGFESLAALHETLDRIYPDQKGDGKSWYRVEFELEKSPEPAEPKEKPPKLDADRARLAQRIRTALDKAVQRSRRLVLL
jgi:hypothetical protein